MQPRFVPGAEGVPIATWDLGGTGPPLLLLHATGFHARCYRALAGGVAERFRVIGVDCRGHGRSGTPDLEPDEDGRVMGMSWEAFATDALAVVDALGLAGTAAFGHSCGGATLLRAEQRRPGTFARIYAYEPVVAAPAFWSRWPEGERAPAKVARRRRAVFSSRAAAADHFGAKPPLSSLRADVLADYVEGGFADQPDGTVRLRCDPQAESATYSMAPLAQVWDHLNEVACPTTLACGGIPGDFGVEQMTTVAARLPNSRVEEHPGLGHLGPFERPDEIALAVGQAFLT